MAFWSKWFSSRASPAIAATAATDAGLFTFGGTTNTAPRRGTRELIEAYRQQPWLRAVASRIARGVSVAEWCVYTRVSTPIDRPKRGVVPLFDYRKDRAVRDYSLQHGSIEARKARREALAEQGLLREVPDHPLLKFLQRPNQWIRTGQKAFYLTQLWLDLKGEAYWLVQKGEKGEPLDFFPLPPHWVTSLPTEADPFYAVNFGGKLLRVPKAAMVVFSDPDPAAPYGRGTGVGESLGDELETDEYASKYLKNWFYNSATPSMLVSYDGASLEQVKLAQEKWDNAHRGVQNAHRAHFSGGKMNAVKIDSSFREQQIPELRKMMRDTIAQVWNVPPEIIGIIENSNRSTIDAANAIMVTGVEFPRAEGLRSELQAQLVPMYDDALVLEVSLAVPPDLGHRLNVMRAMPAAFELNEFRTTAGLKPLDSLDGQHPPLAMPGQMVDAPAPELAAENEPDAVESEDDATRAEPRWAKELRAQN